MADGAAQAELVRQMTLLIEVRDLRRECCPLALVERRMGTSAFSSRAPTIACSPLSGFAQLLGSPRYAPAVEKILREPDDAQHYGLEVW